MENIIDKENMINCIEKIRMYDNDEKINFDNIMKCFQNINNGYITNNFNKLSQIQNILYRKFNIIKINHYNNEVILVQNLNKYIDTAKKVEAIFNNIEK